MERQLMTMREIKIISQKRLCEKHNKINYGDTCIDLLIYNKSSHYSSQFKDRMLQDYIDEFFKRFYIYIESIDRIPKMVKYYSNYLNFFCKPIFRDFYVNTILKRYGDCRAELYYIKNYGQAEEEDRNNRLEIKENIKTLLTTTVKDKINHNSMTQNTSINKSEISHVSNLSVNLTQILIDETFNKTGLATKRSIKDESLVSILFQIDPLKISEHILVKDKMNFKKNLINNHTAYSSNVDKTTKDYSYKTNNINIDLNKIEIKEFKEVKDLKIIEGEYINSSESISDIKYGSPLKYSRINEFKGLNVPCNHLIIKKDELNNMPNDNKTRNKQNLERKSTDMTILQTATSNVCLTQMNNNNSKFLENIKNEALKALQRIKKTKLEFKSIGNKQQNHGKVIYLDTNSNNGNKNLLNLNDMLKLSINDKNSRNINRNESISSNKMTTTLGKNSINRKDINSSRGNFIRISNDIKKINTDKSNSKSPNNKESSSNTQINLNILKNLADKTKTLSRNKSPSLNLMEMKSRNDNTLKGKNMVHSFKSSFKDKSVVTQTVNLNNPNHDIHDLEKKIFGMYATNYEVMKDVVNKNIKLSTSIQKQKSESKSLLKTTKTLNNILYSRNSTPSSSISNIVKSVHLKTNSNRLINYNLNLPENKILTSSNQITVKNIKEVYLSNSNNLMTKNRKTSFNSDKKNHVYDKSKNKIVNKIFPTASQVKK